MRVAVVDLGTNSTRLLVADVRDGSVFELERRTGVTRLGEGVEATGRLSDAAVGRVHAALAAYRRLIGRHAPERILALATSAVRDAANGERFLRDLHELFGVDARVISGEEEARLTFLGATAGRDDHDSEVMVIDIGGGSTEFVVGRPDEGPRFHSSTPLGSVRHTERNLELEALSLDARRIIESNVPAELRREVTTGIAVAGTPTSLAAIELELDPYDAERVHGYALALGSCRRMLDRLASLPLDERRRVTGLHPDRAPTIVAGATILVCAIEAFGLRSIKVSETDLLHGAALDAWAQSA